MSRARGVRGARKMRSFAKDRVTTVASEEAWEAALAQAGDRLLVAEFAASWSAPCKMMAPVLTALSQQPEYRSVCFVRIDIEACPVLGAKNAVLAAPTYHFYRSGTQLASFSGALPAKLVELLQEHKGAEARTSSGWKLLGLLAAVAAAGAWVVLTRAPQHASAPPTAPPAEAAHSETASPPADTPPQHASPEEPKLQSPAKKAAAEPSRGARLE